MTNVINLTLFVALLQKILLLKRFGLNLNYNNHSHEKNHLHPINEGSILRNDRLVKYNRVFLYVDCKKNIYK
jgi:hypothetical protein